MEEIERIWRRLATQFRAEYGDTIYRRWLMSVRVQINEKNIILHVENQLAAESIPEFYGDWLKKKFTSEGYEQDIICQVGAASYEAASKKEKQQHHKTSHPTALNNHYVPNNKIGSYLNNDYSFENFIIGSSNETAVEICKQSLQNQKKSFYNPICIHGEVGIGKTHLLHAVGLAAKEKNTKSKILYLTAESFVQNFVESVKYRNILDFKSALEANDILLLDDLHFMVGKEGSIQQLTSIITIMLEAKKQIFIAADQPCEDMHALGPRLRTRLCQGASLKLDSLTSSMREEILKSKAALKGMQLSESIFSIIAEKVNYGGARELEGILNKLRIFAQTNRRPLTPEICLTFLQKFGQQYEKRVTVDEIQRFISQYYEVRLQDLVSKARQRDIARPRQIAMYLSRQLTTRSLPDIGRRFKRDHTTIIHAIERIEGLCKEQPRLQEEIDYIKRSLIGS